MMTRGAGPMYSPAPSACCLASWRRGLPTRWAQLMPHLLAADLATTNNPALRQLVRRACWYLIERGVGDPLHLP
jgi:hypothetical protein